jgi:hypothetical protein
MIKKILITIVILAVIAGAGWYVWKWQTSKAEPLPEVTTTEYHLFTESDTGRTIENVGYGSVAIVQLTTENYSDITITDSANNPVAFTKEIIDTSTALSFYVRTMSEITVRATTNQPLKKDFTLTIRPKPQS